MVNIADKVKRMMGWCPILNLENSQTSHINSEPSTIYIDTKEYLRQFEAYRGELDQIGFILTGSITKRFMRCGTVGCRCQTDPKALHGPYYEWTRKVQGKTVSVRLKKGEAEQLMEWIENKRHFYRIISKMEKTTLEAVNLIRI